MFQLCRWTLAWFVLALGAAALSPLVQAKSTVIVCSTNGQFKWVPMEEPATPSSAKHLLDCPLCILADAPAPTPGMGLPLWPPRGGHALPIDTTPVVPATATPPPARGPPFFSQSISKRSLP
jgi:hypothetical protein